MYMGLHKILFRNNFNSFFWNIYDIMELKIVFIGYCFFEVNFLN